MSDVHYELPGTHELNDTESFTLPRAIALVNALTSRKRKDYSLKKLLCSPADCESKFECLVVDVACDGVPSSNHYGIAFRERFALCVPEDPKKLVEVLALRKTFPRLMHQNAGAVNNPASLCLYFESAIDVNRTWTAQKFLNRILWWLEKSAKGQLHPVDQPVEQLFFTSKYELVIPWNFSELQSERSERFVISPQPERPDSGLTFCLKHESSRESKNMATFEPIQLTLPPVVHATIEIDPQNLGELVDLLRNRNIDLAALLFESLQARVGDGVDLNENDKCSLLLLHTPICRQQGHPPEAWNHRAFFFPICGLDLGLALGALLLTNKTYHRQVLINRSTENIINETSTKWRALILSTMQVLKENDTSRSRTQSGIAEEGPLAVIIGAGSLGSALLNLWGRSGWGKWTVIDNDHIKPHNLSRHTAGAPHIGRLKVEAVAHLHALATCGASEIKPLYADATDFANDTVTESLTKAQLVIDASTSLAYPRAASRVDAFARHISVFITPDGNAGVLLAEDSKRSISLRTLEAQYYRALIQQDVGKVHLTSNTSSFWSGSSCRDISLVLPYSKILVQASTLAEQIPHAFASENASIRIWQRDPALGVVEVHDVPTATERSVKLGGYDLYIDAGAEQQLRSLRSNALPNETGGVLLGYYDFNINAIIVVAGLPPPSDSKADHLSFERGKNGVEEAIKKASQWTAGNVVYIGEWHSHPKGHSAAPSNQDAIQLTYLANHMAEEGLPAVQLIVGEDDIQVFIGKPSE